MSALPAGAFADTNFAMLVAKSGASQKHAGVPNGLKKIFTQKRSAEGVVNVSGIPMLLLVVSLP